MVVTRTDLKNEQGSVVIFAMVALLLLSSFGFILVNITTSDVKKTNQALETTQGEYIANGALLQVLETYKGIAPQGKHTLKNLYTDKNGHVYSAEVTMDMGVLLLNRKISVVALKNTKAIYSLTADVSFFSVTSSTVIHGYSINSIVQNTNPIYVSPVKK